MRTKESPSPPTASGGGPVTSRGAGEGLGSRHQPLSHEMGGEGLPYPFSISREMITRMVSLVPSRISQPSNHRASLKIKNIDLLIDKKILKWVNPVRQRIFEFGS